MTLASWGRGWRRSYSLCAGLQLSLVCLIYRPCMRSAYKIVSNLRTMTTRMPSTCWCGAVRQLAATGGASTGMGSGCRDVRSNSLSETAGRSQCLIRRILVLRCMQCLLARPFFPIEDGYSTLASLTSTLNIYGYQIRPKLHMFAHLQRLGICFLDMH